MGPSILLITGALSNKFNLKFGGKLAEISRNFSGTFLQRPPNDPIRELLINGQQVPGTLQTNMVKFTKVSLRGLELANSYLLSARPSYFLARMLVLVLHARLREHLCTPTKGVKIISPTHIYCVLEDPNLLELRSLDPLLSIGPKR